MPESGLFERVDDTRIIRGLLLPFGEQSRPNASGNEPIEFSAESISLPRDPSVVTLNDEHDRFAPLGRATSLTATERGIEAEFAIADTDEGDAYLAAPKRKLSAEVAGIVRQGAKAIRSKLTGAAVVHEGAFASAALFALAPGEEITEEAEPEDDAHLRVALATEDLPEDITAITPEGQTAVYTPDATPAEETPNADEEEEMTASANAGAAVPVTLGGNVATKNDEIEPSAVFSAMAAVKNSMSGQSADAETLLAALSDITVNTTGGLTTAASGVLQPAWVGKLWQGKRYSRKYIDLVNHLYGGIQLGGRKGFTLDRGTALVQHWAGNKTELPTGKGTTGTKGSTLRKYGYGADVAGEWFDLEGGAEVIQAFFEGVIDSYAEITDADALADIMAVALANVETPGTSPTQYPAAMGTLIDAIEAVQDGGDDPTFALVNPVAWRQLIQTPKDLVPEFVSFNFSTGGDGNGDGKVQIRKAPASAFVGLSPTEIAVVAGAKNGLELREQGQTPIQIEAANIAKHGVDKAVVGYLETFVVRPESFVAFGTDAA